MSSSFLRFLDHTQRRTTVGRTALDNWSARPRDLYLTTHNTHNRQASMPPVGFERTLPAGKRPQIKRNISLRNPDFYVCMYTPIPLADYVTDYRYILNRIIVLANTVNLTFRHRASCILGQAFRYSPEDAFYIFNQQIYFIIWYLLDRTSLI